MAEDGIEEHLAAPEEADALVDLSNVVRDARLGDRRHQRSLDRLRLLIEALARRTGDRNVQVCAIADGSLRAPTGYPDRAQPRRLARWIDRGLVEQAEDADPPLLELADLTGLPVVSNDDFADFRVDHPWIQGNTTQFLGFVPLLNGAGVLLRERDMGVRTPAQISRKLEESDLKRHGLLVGRHRRPLTEIVKRSWRCPERGCSLYDSRRGVAVRLPYVRRGVPQCELHRVPLVDDGPRTGIVQLKLHVDGACVHRFTLEAGTTVELGRAPEPDGIALYDLLPGHVRGRVSRRHLAARVEEGNVLLVRNLSAGGTRLLRCGAPEWRALAEEFVPFHVNDVVELVPGVTLTRSARRYPPEIAAAWRGSARRLTGPGPAHAATESW